MHNSASLPQPVPEPGVSDGGRDRIAAEQGFKLAETGDAPFLDKLVQQVQVITQQVEQVDCAGLQTRVYKGHSKNGSIGLWVPALRGR